MCTICFFYKKIWILKYINVSSTLNVGDNDGDMSETLSVTFHTENL